jgi:hypothetical protein
MARISAVVLRTNNNDKNLHFPSCVALSMAQGCLLVLFVDR